MNREANSSKMEPAMLAPGLRESLGKPGKRQELTESKQPESHQVSYLTASSLKILPSTRFGALVVVVSLFFGFF